MAKKITLKFLTGPIKGQSFSFENQDEIIIGRLDDCDITLKDPKISSEHCGIFLEDDDYYLEDFDSTNGTYINTTKVSGEDYLIEGGETLFLGSSKIAVLLASSNVRKQAAVKPQQPVYDDDEDDEEFELDDDTNIKRVAGKKGIKKFFDIDYYLDLKEKFMALEPMKKGIVVVAVVLFMALIIGVASSGSSKGGKGFFKKSYDDNSEEILMIAPENMGRPLGYMASKASGKEDFSHPKKVRLKFKASRQEKFILYYAITKTEYLDEVIIKLNDVQIGTTPLTSHEVHKVKLSLPFDNLNFDGDNLIEFINKKNLVNKHFKHWGVAILKLEKRLLPKPDYEKAQENYVKAEKFYEQKRISRGNRYKALTYYRAAIDFMELLNEKPDFYDDSIEKIKMIKKEFDKIYQDNRYAALRAFKFQKYKEAKLYINNIIEEIPDEEDSRYNTALRMLNSIP